MYVDRLHRRRCSGPLALFPNHPDNRNPAGGANTEYTAADFQHMLLAAQVANGTGGADAALDATSGSVPLLGQAGQSVLPTSQPPAISRTAAQDIPAELKRAIIMRPLPDDHPNFTGSNPTYTGAGGTASYQSGFNPCWDGISTYGRQRRRLLLGRRQRRRRRARQRVGRSGDAGADDLGRAVVQAAVRHSLRRSRRPLEPQRPRLAGGACGERGRSLSSPVGGKASANGVRGQGFGPAEVRLDGFLGTSNYQQVLHREQRRAMKAATAHGTLPGSAPWIPLLPTAGSSMG